MPVGCAKLLKALAATRAVAVGRLVSTSGSPQAHYPTALIRQGSVWEIVRRDTYNPDATGSLYSPGTLARLEDDLVSSALWSAGGGNFRARSAKNDSQLSADWVEGSRYVPVEFSEGLSPLPKIWAAGGLYFIVESSIPDFSVFTSANGLSFAEGTGTDVRCQVAYGSGVYVGGSSYSGDGYSWAANGLPENLVSAVTYVEGSGFIAAHNGTKVSVSATGTSWTSRPDISSLWAPYIFVQLDGIVVGLSGSAAIVSSDFGLSWTIVGVSGPVKAATVIDNDFVIVGGSYDSPVIMSSSNGLGWVSEDLPTPPTGLVWADGIEGVA